LPNIAVKRTRNINGNTRVKKAATGVRQKILFW
jgi:hypothetical protein